MPAVSLLKTVGYLSLKYRQANFLGIFTPAITLCLYAVIARLSGSALDVETAFTTTAILMLVTHPANMLMTIIPQAVAALTSFERIQNYLLESSREDQRLEIRSSTTTASSFTDVTSAVKLANLRIDAPNTNEAILQDIDLVIATSTVTAISGRIGSGKSTLVRAILGEVVPAAGTVAVSTKQIALCSQTPWLPSATIKSIIEGYPLNQHVDYLWYHKVIAACCLKHDLKTFPNGDGTIVGSRGMKLSGGQRQRVVRFYVFGI
jgi:ATP-binding cassette subfamily C (CFTR/MRP) protein 1